MSECPEGVEQSIDFDEVYSEPISTFSLGEYCGYATQEAANVV